MPHDNITETRLTRIEVAVAFTLLVVAVIYGVPAIRKVHKMAMEKAHRAPAGPVR